MVYRRPAWPMRILVGAMLAIGVLLAVVRPAAGGVFLGIWVVLGAGLLFANERPRVVTSPDGVKVVPLFGRSRELAWSEINGFSVGRVPGGRYGGPVVSVSITDRSILLKPTLRSDGAREAVQHTCDQLNAELERARSRMPG
jgi:hypothetical protein